MITRRLGSIETAWALGNDFSPLTGIVVLRLANGPTPEQLKRALAIIQQQQPLLRSAIKREKGHYFFNTANQAPPIPVTVIPGETADQWQTVAETLAKTPMATDVAPLLKCHYIYSSEPELPDDLILNFHHSILDATSGGRFIEQLLAACQAVGEGRAADDSPPPPETAVPAPIDDRLPPAFRGWRHWSLLARFAGRQFIDELNYRRRPHPPTILIPGAQNKIITARLSQPATTALVRRTRQQKLSLNNVLLAATLLATHRHLYGGQNLALRPLFFADLRPYLDPRPDETQLGCYIAMLRYTFQLHPEADLWSLAATIQDESYRANRRGDKFLASVIARHLMWLMLRFKPDRLGHLAVSYTGPLNLQRNYGSIELEDVHIFVSNHFVGPPFSGVVKILSGELSWDMIYLDTDMKAAQAQKIVAEMIGLLTV